MKTEMFEKIDEIKIPAGKNILKPKKKRKAAVVIVAAALLLSLIFVAAQILNTSSVNISAHFSSVTDGKNPDGSPFDVSEMLSDEVLERASEKLGGRVDAETLRMHLSISDNTSAGDVLALKQKIVDGDTDYSYFPNVYTLTYSVVSEDIKRQGVVASVNAAVNQFFMPGKKEILKSVAESYDEYYTEKYIESCAGMKTDWINVDVLDYFNKAEGTKSAAEKISRFVWSKYDENPEFVSASGIGYGELCTEIDRIISIDIENYMSYVIQNGLTVDKDSLLRQFAFMENMYNEANTRHMSAYGITKEAIEYYDANTTRVVFVPALDDERVFYMNRTKVGIDYLIEKASEEKIAANEAFYNAEKYRYLTESFSNSSPASKVTYEAADKMYTDIKEKINRFTANAETVIVDGTKSKKHEKIDLGKPYSSIDLVSMAIVGGKSFIMLLIVAFLLASLFEGAGKLVSKRELEDK